MGVLLAYGVIGTIDLAEDIMKEIEEFFIHAKREKTNRASKKIFKLMTKRFKKYTHELNSYLANAKTFLKIKYWDEQEASIKNAIKF
jgi:hypothetical protein